MTVNLQAASPPRSWADPSSHLTAAVESPWYHLITELNAAILNETTAFYRQRHVVPVLLPVTTSSISSPMGLGSDSLPVDIELHGQRTYLADSMQFQLEFMLRHGLSGAFYVMPTFRGEDPDATHLNQFFHSEAEIRGGLEDVMALVEDYLRALTVAVLASDGVDRVAGAAGGLEHLETFVAKSSLPRVTFDDARAIVSAEHVVALGPDAAAITRAGEQLLIEEFGGAVWLERPPSSAVPFYQKADEHGRALSADLLLGVGEVVGCGERWASGTDVLKALAAHRVDPVEYRWYVEMKDRYPLQTAGFGLGLERFLLWVLHHDDIRDIHVMPRLKGITSWV